MNSRPTIRFFFDNSASSPFWSTIKKQPNIEGYNLPIDMFALGLYTPSLVTKLCLMYEHMFESEQDLAAFNHLVRPVFDHIAEANTQYNWEWLLS